MSQPRAAPRRRVVARPSPRRTVLVAALALAIALVIPFLVVRAAHTIANSRAGRSSPTIPAAGNHLPSTPGALLTILDASGHVVGLAVFAVDPSGGGGTVVVLPAGIRLAGTGDPQRLGDAHDQGGAQAEVDAMEGYLEVSFSATADAARADLERLLAPYTPVAMSLADKVVDAGTNGSDTTVFPAGPVTLDAAGAARLLTAHGRADTELARLGRTTAFWTALLAQAGRHGGAAAANGATTTAPAAGGGAGPTDLPGFLAAVTAGPAAVRQPAVTPVIDPVQNPHAVDLLDADLAEVRLIMAEVLPGAVSPPDTGVRVHLVDSGQDADLARLAVGRLISTGANVVWATRAGGTRPATTTIEYESADTQAAVGDLKGVLGVGNVVAAASRTDGVDAVVVLGQDFRTLMDAEQARATTTTAAQPTTSAPPAPTTTTKPKTKG